MPLTLPATSLRNLTPSSTGLVSVLVGFVGTLALVQMLVGTVPGAPAVENEEVNGAAIGEPDGSVAVTTLTVYVVSGARLDVGVNVAVALPTLYVSAPGTSWFCGLRSSNTIEAGVTC